MKTGTPTVSLIVVGEDPWSPEQKTVFETGNLDEILTLLDRTPELPIKAEWLSPLAFHVVSRIRDSRCKKPTIELKIRTQNTELELAILFGDTSRCRDLLKSGHIDLNCGQFSPLKLAVRMNHLKIVSLLLHFRADVNFGTVDSPITLAANLGRVEAGELLVRANCNVIHTYHMHHQAVYYLPPMVLTISSLTEAVAQNRCSFVRMLLREHASRCRSTNAPADTHEKFVNFRSQSKRQMMTALHAVAVTGCLSCLRELLAHGVFVDGPSGTINGRGVLFQALVHNKREIAKVLLENTNADPNASGLREVKFRVPPMIDLEEHSPLMVAVGQNDLEMVKLLVSRGALLDISIGYNFVLRFAKTPEMLSLLLQLRERAGIDFRNTIWELSGVFALVCSNGQVDNAVKCIEEGADMDMEQYIYASAVTKAFRAGSLFNDITSENVQTLESILEHGCDVGGSWLETTLSAYMQSTGLYGEITDIGDQLRSIFRRHGMFIENDGDYW